MTQAPVIESRSLVRGAWRDAHERIGMLHDPNTGAVRTPQIEATPSEVEDALDAAAALYRSGALERRPASERAATLRAWADQLDTHTEEIALQDAVSTGNPLRTTRVLASFLGARVRSIAEQAARIGDANALEADGRLVRQLHRALGPTLVLAPWNAPSFVAVSKVAAALGAGSPVIVKPSEWAPGGAQIVFALLHEVLVEHDAPTSSVQMVHGAGRVGAALASDPRIRVITFTGGLAAGRAVARAAAETLAVTQLELGSNNPAIVLADADITHTATALVEGVTRLNGQWCEAPGKVIVPRSRHDELLDALVSAFEQQRITDCLAEECDLGPLAYRSHRDRLESQLDAYARLGADIHRVGLLPDLGGWFFAPAIVTGLHAADAVDEMFGPALTMHAVDSVDEALEAANLPGGGLDGFVFGADEETAVEVGSLIHAGEVRVNGTKMADLADGSEQTFWAASGVGGHGVAQGVALYQGRRVVGVDSDALPI